jgi:hypothetical protein
VSGSTKTWNWTENILTGGCSAVAIERETTLFCLQNKFGSMWTVHVGLSFFFFFSFLRLFDKVFSFFVHSRCSNSSMSAVSWSW